MRKHRARRPMPAVLLVVILSTMAGAVWVSVLLPDSSAGGCQAVTKTSGTAVTPGERLATDGLDGVPPAPPEQVRVQVLNANGLRGVAAIAGGRLSELGFSPTGRPANDPLRPAFDLPCHGEIRFGPAGQSAARTLSLVMPCAELVRDARPGSTVDLALGTRFTALRPNSAAHAALQDLATQGRPAQGRSAQEQPTQEQPTQEQAAQGQSALASAGGRQTAQMRASVVSQELLRQARQVQC